MILTGLGYKPDLIVIDLMEALYGIGGHRANDFPLTSVDLEDFLFPLSYVSTMKIVHNAMVKMSSFLTYMHSPFQKLTSGNPYQHYFYLYIFSPLFTGWPPLEPNRLITLEK
uniref:Uncharacterized protein n=1 Tax=Glossina pallidipes TaxID=7398 RepID=A0A1A9ZA05_GLOPL